MSTKVVRIRRQGGAVVQGCDVYIGRAINMGGWRLPQSKWANPFKVENKNVKEAVDKYRQWIQTQPQLLADIHELKGKTLGCWCKNKPSDLCHGDVLVELVNKIE